MTAKDTAKDAPAIVLALGIPLLAAALNAWGFLVDSLVIAPFVWLGLRRGLAQSTGLILLAAAAIYFVSRDPLLTVGKGVLLTGVAVVFSLGIRRGWKASEMLFWASMVLVPYVLLNLYAIGPDFQGKLEQAYSEMFQQMGMAEVIKSTQGLSESQAMEQLQQISNIGAAIFPAVMLLTGIASVMINFVAVRFVLKKTLDINLPAKPFKEWALPWYAVWGAILGLAAYLVGDNWGISWMVTIGINIGLVYFMVCFLLGTAVLAFIFSSPKVPLILKLSIILITLFNIYGLILVSLLGLFDMVLSFRTKSYAKENRQ